MNVNANSSTQGGGNRDFSPVSGAPRVAPDQWRAFGGVWRLTAWAFLSRKHLLTVAGMTALLGFLAWRMSQSNLPGAYSGWVAGFYLTVAVPVLGFLSGAGAMRDQLKSSATDYVFTRPVRRWAFVAFKYVAHVVWTQVGWLPASGVVAFFANARGVDGATFAYPSVLLAQALTLGAFVALGFLCAMLTKRYLIVGMVYAAIVEAGVGNIPAPLSRLSVTRQVRELLPAEGWTGSVSAGDALGVSVTVVLFCAVFVCLAALMFSLRELVGERGGE